MADSSPTGPSGRRISWGTRILAPLALVAALLALYAIVSSADVGDGGGESTGNERTAEDPAADENKDGPENPRTYEVEDGDSLSTIAEKFDVSVDRLERLNPDVDPQALTTGQELTIR